MVPLLSVIIPTWNRAGWVCEAIDSALQQGQLGTIEVIVIDDGSTDNTRELLQQQYGKTIVYQRLDQRSGVGQARNQGVALASGKLLAFLDSDDIWLPGKLATEQAIFDYFPQADVVISNSLSFAEGVAEKHNRFEANGLSAAIRDTQCWVTDCDWLWTNSENGVATCSITMRRNTPYFLNTELFAEDLISCEDWELELKLYQQCRVRVTPSILAHVRSFDDATRVERPAAYLQGNTAQMRNLLQCRLKVMERTQLVPHLSDKLYQEFDRVLALTKKKLLAIEPSF